jgi:YHS domain-containing protein
MKIIRFLNPLIVFVVALTLLGPSPVYAQSINSINSVEFAATAAGGKTATLVVQNESGGTLYVNLSGPKTYYFSTSKAGQTQFTNIEPGKYTITIRASTCGDVVTVVKKLDGKVNLKNKKEIVCAKTAGKDKKNQKASSLTVDNRTGGTLYVTLTGPKTYYFNTSKSGKSTFEGIEQGKYTITVRSSACSGSLTYTKNFKGKVSLKPFVCY